MKIIRSFSRKINLGNYETSDFYCEAEDEVLGHDAGIKEEVELSEVLHSFCKEEVERSIQEFLKEREKNKLQELLSQSTPVVLSNSPKLNFTNEPK